MWIWKKNHNHYTYRDCHLQAFREVIDGGLSIIKGYKTQITNQCRVIAECVEFRFVTGDLSSSFLVTSTDITVAYVLVE